jgi:hypothetical protein
LLFGFWSGSTAPLLGTAAQTLSPYSHRNRRFPPTSPCPTPPIHTLFPGSRGAAARQRRGDG